jgi:hypothetical protein
MRDLARMDLGGDDASEENREEQGASGVLDERV